MRFPKLYECDPQKNTECNKRNCGNPCKHTTRKEFAREPSGSELLGKRRRLHGSRDALRDAGYQSVERAPR